MVEKKAWSSQQFCLTATDASTSCRGWWPDAADTRFYSQITGPEDSEQFPGHALARRII